MADKGKGIADDLFSGKRKRGDGSESGRRMRKNPGVLQFFEESAFEVDDSGSDEDDFINDALVEDEFDADIQVKTEPKTPNLPFFPKEEEMDVDELEKMLGERYKPGSSFVRYAEDHPQAAGLGERSTFMAYAREPYAKDPYEKDPTIWKVKCMAGRERHSAFCLMQKYVDRQSLGTKLQIISAFAVDHIKGYVYIEADKQSDINEACKGLCNIYPSRVAPVPISEVSHLFSARSKYSGISVDTWARVKNGKYKGDLAQVVNVNEAQRKATVKLIPRIDLQAIAEKFGGGVKGKKCASPAPRLISSSELELYRPLVQYRRDRDTGEVYELFDGMMLKDGYLFKKVSLDSLSFWSVLPSESELLKFEPPKKEESQDVEWLTGLFGDERKKKKQTINNDKCGGKGEGSSSSSMENSFEVHDLVFHGRKGFGVVIGREKDDRIKVLEEGTERPVVVPVEARLLKKASFEKKFTALDQHKKIISINDTVRILEGPLEDKQGIVKQIYKGIIFLHDENEQENCGYFCAKAQICEKMEFSADILKGKGGKSDASCFDDFPSSPKSPLSPKKPWEGRENGRNANREDKDGFSVGQSVRIRLGPLKGYLCRVMAIRYSDITVKLDSQHKILTVKSQHLAEVREKSSGVSASGETDSTKPFELLGDHDSSQGWMDHGVASSETGGWNTGGPSTERNSWAPFPASASSFNPGSSTENNDANEDVGVSAWDTKKTGNQSSAWGAAADNVKAVTNTEQAGGWGKPEDNTSGGWGKPEDNTSGGWGKAEASWGKGTSNTEAGATVASGWGTAKTSDDGGEKWGSAKPGETSKVTTSSWGKNNNLSDDQVGEGTWDRGKSILGAPPSSWNNAEKGKSSDGSWNKDKTSETKSAWNSAAPANQSGGWGNPGGGSDLPKSETSGWNKNADVSGGQAKGWGKSDASTGDGGSSWGKQSAGSSWGSGKKEDENEAAAGWAKSGSSDQGQSGGWNKTNSSGGGWGNSKGSDGGNNDNAGASGWKSASAGTGGESGNWGSAKKTEGTSGWGNKQEGGSSWSKPAGGSWNNQDGGGSSWNKPDGGSSSWGKAAGGGSSWSNEDGGPALGKEGGRGRGDRNGGRGGYNGGRGRGGGGNACFKCGETGHMSRECPQGGGGGGGNACFKCGETGHMSRECPQGGGGGGNACFKCGETGHMARECPKGGGAGGNACFKCGETGHMSRECPKGGGGNACFKCGETGHMARDCSQGGGNSRNNCFKCGESGHMSRDCSQGGNGGSGGGGNTCFKCGESGHRARECPQGGGGGGNTCFKCGEAGHMARECSQSGGSKYGGGGRGGSSWGGGGGGQTGGWGSTKNSDDGSDAGGNRSWGGGGQAGGWGSTNNSDAGGGAVKTGGWGSSKASDGGGDTGKTRGWGSSEASDDGGGSSWGNGGQMGWGANKPSDGGGSNGGQTGGWGSTTASDGVGSNGGGGWGSSSGGGGKASDAEGTGWKKGSNGDSSWGSGNKMGDSGSGWNKGGSGGGGWGGGGGQNGGSGNAKASDWKSSGSGGGGGGGSWGGGGDQAGGLGSGKASDAEGSGWKKGGNW